MLIPVVHTEHQLIFSLCAFRRGELVHWAVTNCSNNQKLQQKRVNKISEIGEKLDRAFQDCTAVITAKIRFCGSGSYLTGLQDVDLLLVDSVSVLFQKAFTLIFHLLRQQPTHHLTYLV